MHRTSIIPSNDIEQTFFGKLRHGFRTTLSECSKVEKIVADLPRQLPANRSYFADQAAILEPERLEALRDETRCLYRAIFDVPIDLNDLEQRLLDARQRLIAIEEDPHLLSLGYQPYRPPDISVNGDDCISNEHDATDLPDSATNATNIDANDDDDNVSEKIETERIDSSGFKKPQFTPKTSTYTKLKITPIANCNTNSKNNNHNKNGQTPVLDIPVVGADLSRNSVSHQPSSSIPATTKCEEKKINDPRIAKCLDILKRWTTLENGSSSRNGISFTSIGSSSSNFTTSKETASTANDNRSLPKESEIEASSSVTVLPKIAVSAKKSDRSQTSEDLVTPTTSSITRCKTFTKPRSFAAPPLFAAVEFDTVEFTPGMTTKVARK